MAESRNISPVGKIPAQNRASADGALGQAGGFSGGQQDGNTPPEKKKKKVLLQPDEDPGVIYRPDGAQKPRQIRTMDKDI